jgi:restriction endonuclease Mrr
MLPRYEAIYLPLLLEISERGGKARPGDHRDGRNVYDALAVFFNLTREDLDAVVEGPSVESKWENMVRWARRKLVDMGCIDGSEWGVWKLTEKGRKAAKSKRIPDLKIDEKLIKSILELPLSARSEVAKLTADHAKKAGDIELLDHLRKAGLLE